MNLDLGDLEKETVDSKEMEERNKHPSWKLNAAACQASHRLC